MTANSSTGVRHFNKAEMPRKITTEAGLKQTRYTPGKKSFAAPAPSVNLYGYRDYCVSLQERNGWTQVNNGETAKFLWADQLTEQGYIMSSGWTVGTEKVCGYFLKLDDEGSIIGARYQEMNASDGTTILTKKISVSDDDMSNYNLTAAYNIYDSYIYGYNYTADAQAIDFVKAPSDDPGHFTVVAEPANASEVPVTLCFRADTNLFYGVLQNGWFVSIDKEGRSEKLFDTEIRNIGYLSAMTWDNNDKVFYYNAILKETDGFGTTSPASYLYKIDPEKRVAEQIYPFEPFQTFTTLSTLREYNRPEAPATPEVTGCNFEGSNLFGTVTFKLPSALFNGQSISGNITWTAYDGTKEIKTGSGTPGSEVTVSYSDLSQGFHTFRLIAKANDYSSLPAFLTKYIGYDTPAVPQNVAVNGCVVSWDKVTEGINNGYLNAANIEYKVYFIDHYDYDDNLPEPILFKTTKETSCDLGLDPDETIYAYRVYVVATANEQESGKSATVKFNYGKPYSIDNYNLRPYADQADVMKVVTYAGQGWEYDISGWEWLSGASELTPVDSWLILPPIEITEIDKAFRFTLNAANASALSPDEFFEIKLGKKDDPASMTQTILAKCGPTTTDMDGQEISTVFAVSEPGIYYPAVRCISDPDQSSVAVWKFDLEKTENELTAPAAATDIVVTPADKGELKASISFKMPTVDLTGSALPASEKIKARISSAGKESEVEGTPGQTVSTEIEAVQNANNLIITCYKGYDEGATIYTRFRAGIGVPGAVQNLKSSVGDDNRSVSMTWEYPGESPEDLYFPTTGITYWLVEKQLFKWSVTEEIGIDKLSYTYNLPDYMTRQYMTPLGVIAENAAGMSPYFASTYHVLGDPYPLPLEEYFPGGTPSQQYFSLEGNDIVDNWDLYFVESVSPEMANESGIALMNFPDNAGQKSRLMFAKFSTEDVRHASLTMSLWAGSRLAPTKVMARCAGSMEYCELGVINPTEGKKWEKLVFELPDDMMNKGWCEIVLESTFDNLDQIVMIENYVIASESEEGISAVEDGSLADVRVVANRLAVIGGASSAMMTVWDVAGRQTIAPVIIAPHSRSSFTLPAGIYIVKLGNATYKVAIKE